MTSWYEKRRFGDLPRDVANKFPQREALVFRNERYSFSEVNQAVDQTAKGFMALGVQPGDHVSLWLTNCCEWIFAMYALSKIGAVHVPINTRFRTQDLEYVLRQSDSSMLITHDISGPIDYLGMVKELVRLPADGGEIESDAFPCLKRVVILGEQGHDGTVPWSALKSLGATVSDDELRARSDAVGPDKPVFIMYTSGTTGFPKGVVHSHKLVRNIEERAFRMAITENDVILNYLPLFHAFGYSEGALMSMVSGAKQVLTDVFDPHECLDLIPREGVSLMNGFEAHMKDLTEAQEARPRDLRTLRTGVFAAGMHSATPVNRRGAKVLAPLRALSGFGMTEIWLGAMLGTLDDDIEHRCETSGYPGLGYEVKIIHPETGAEQPVGEQGEIVVRGYSVMLEYYKKPEETAASYTTDGWFKTGDTGVRLEDGYIRFLGRYKDMLKVGGENVDPMEVEGLLLGHPDVHQVAIVGTPDPRLSEVGVAYVQRVPNSQLAPESVIEYCRGKVASFKIPRHVVFVEEFPMTASGKIRKVELRERAERELKPPQG
ncbi:MAG: AMP-binding protein [Gammaproteobacteria bacterium]|nr:AMP-binding protein [Gammaproteobacteria bacterium]